MKAEKCIFTVLTMKRLGATLLPEFKNGYKNLRDSAQNFEKTPAIMDILKCNTVGVAI